MKVNELGYMGEQQTKFVIGLSAVSLAFMGDAVLSLLVRERLVIEGLKPNVLHKEAINHVSATSQASVYHILFEISTEEEQSILKRGRNAATNHKAKNAKTIDYRHSTGVEALFGYLHLTKNTQRMMELFEILWKNQ